MIWNGTETEKIELVETKQLQLHAMVQIYQALGGGWN